MDAQEMHDLQMAEQEGKGPKADRQKVEALLRKKNGSSLEPSPSGGRDIIAIAMKDNPGLTRERAAQMLDDLGY